MFVGNSWRQINFLTFRCNNNYIVIMIMVIIIIIVFVGTTICINMAGGMEVIKGQKRGHLFASRVKLVEDNFFLSCIKAEI